METESTGQPKGGGRGEDVGMGQDAVHIEPTLCTVATELHLLLVLEYYNRHVVIRAVGRDLEVGQPKVYCLRGVASRYTRLVLTVPPA